MSKTYNVNKHDNGVSDIQRTTDTEAIKNIYVPDSMDTIFRRLAAQDVEQFYKSYHLWCLQQRMKMLQSEIGALQQAIADNSALMQQVQPSAIALASLAQLQACGVNDLKLLDKMLARGDSWLDHTMQLLEQCEALDVIRGDYTQWCQHALEGAYEWMFSIKNREDASKAATPTATAQQELQTPTEEQLLLKLMSDEQVTDKIPISEYQLDEVEQASLHPAAANKKITQPLEHLELAVPEAPLLSRKITQPLEQPEQEGIGASVRTRKNTQPLELDNVSPKNSASILPEVNDAITIEEAQPVPAQLEEMKDSTTPITEQIGASSSQEDRPDDTETAVAFKDADISTEVGITEKRLVSVVTADQTRGASKGLVASSQERNMPQTQKVRQRGFWHWLRRVVAAILRR
jgi:hypothetical protein